MTAIVTRPELVEAGLVPNPHLWIGDGWIYCRVCERYTFHQAWSVPQQAQPVCFEVCLSCNYYSGRYPVPRAVPVGVQR